MGFDLARMPQMRGAAAAAELIACNEATARLGLRLSADDMEALAARRGEALRATGRVEFGQGVLRELARGFGSSPFIMQEGYAETLADVQDVFYRCKDDAEAGESGEAMADDDLIEALRDAFDHEAGGSVAALADLSAADLRARIARKRAGDYDEMTQHGAFEAGESREDDSSERGRDELDRALDDARRRRPGNEYAADFYSESFDLYRAGFDSNSRIGGSTLG